MRLKWFGNFTPWSANDGYGFGIDGIMLNQ